MLHSAPPTALMELQRAWPSYVGSTLVFGFLLFLIVPI
jgi:hypothetical protein